MSAKFLISRKVTDNNMMELTVLLRKMRSLTVHQSGYMSAENFRRVDIFGESMAFNTWCSVDDWNTWVKN